MEITKSKGHSLICSDVFEGLSIVPDKSVDLIFIDLLITLERFLKIQKIIGKMITNILNGAINGLTFAFKK